MANRILSAIARIEDRLKNLDKTKLARLEKANKSLDSAEHFGYQEAQARACANGRLSTAEAQVLYQTLSSWSKAPLSHRLVTIMTMAEIL